MIGPSLGSDQSGQFEIGIGGHFHWNMHWKSLHLFFLQIFSFHGIYTNHQSTITNQRIPRLFTLTFFTNCSITVPIEINPTLKSFRSFNRV